MKERKEVGQREGNGGRINGQRRRKEEETKDKRRGKIVDGKEDRDK